MYKLLLISKYLRRKLAPLFAAVAVTICTAMVIIVASVMGGFLDLMQTTAKQLTPDVVISTPSLTGFEGYADLIQRLEAEPEVAIATPVIATPASATIGEFTVQVMVQGIDPAAFNRVVPYNDTLMWTGGDLLDTDPVGFTPEQRRELLRQYDLRAAGQTLTTPAGFERFGMARGGPAAVLGVEANPYQSRNPDGSYSFERGVANIAVTAGYDVNPIKLAMPVFSPSGEPIDATQLRIPAVNEFKSGYYEIDRQVVYVPFDWLQKSLQMQGGTEYTEFDEVTGLGGEEVVREARCTGVYLKAAEGVDVASMKDKAQQITEDFLAERGRPGFFLSVQDWEEVNGPMLNAVKNEKGLVTFLFAIISVVAIVMVATTFYMIVLEKTRDIGVLRAIGAPATGVLNLFLSYGLAIGLIGAAAGVWLAWFTVTNLNHLQDALATRMFTLIGVVVLSGLVSLAVAIAAATLLRRRDFSLGAGVLVFLGAFVLLMAACYYGFESISLPLISGHDSEFGWRMWDPQTYFFDRIPDKVHWGEVLWIGVGAVISSVLGAIIPAVIAARLNPVEALRYE